MYKKYENNVMLHKLTKKKKKKKKSNKYLSENIGMYTVIIWLRANDYRWL